jgi:hypothetical protein
VLAASGENAFPESPGGCAPINIELETEAEIKLEVEFEDRDRTPL